MHLASIVRMAPLLLAMPLTAHAANPVPEITRGAATQQAVGALHTVRGIPEACARIEGRFTGKPEQPYVIGMVRTHPQCQPRARLLDAASAKPSVEAGWVLNDLVRIPSAACPSQQAVVHVWRRPGGAVPPQLDAQGRSRIYLEEVRGTGATGARGALTLYAVALKVEGASCRP